MINFTRVFMVITIIASVLIAYLLIEFLIADWISGVIPVGNNNVAWTLFGIFGCLTAAIYFFFMAVFFNKKEK